MVIDSAQLKATRRRLKLTQAGLAAELGVTVQAVKNWESGRRSCKASAAQRVLALAGSTVAAPAPSASSRPKYRDLAQCDWGSAAGYGWIELKYDGHYTEIEGGPNGWTAYSRSGAVVASGPEPLPRCRLLAERITDTEWAENYGRRLGLYDTLVVWGALTRTGAHVSRARIEALVDAAAAAGLPVSVSKRFALKAAPAVWRVYVERQGWEGLIFRTAGGRFARMKHRTSADYVCMGRDGASLIGGLYVRPGKLVALVRVPCDEDPRVGHTFEASGLAVTDSGSLRNPHWERWRPDKDPAECARNRSR